MAERTETGCNGTRRDRSLDILQRIVSLTCLAALIACAPHADSRRGGLPPSMTQDQRKEVVCVVEPLPNYITHLTALSGLPWRTAYADLYGHTVDVEGHQILLRHAPLLQWGLGITGDLAPFFVLLPAYLPLSDEFDLFEYMRAVDEAMRGRDYDPIARLYPRAQARLSRWMFDFEGFFHSRSDVYEMHLRAVRQLVHVYEHSFQSWDEDVWHQTELELDLAADELNGDLWSLDLLRTWEQLTGERFKGDRFEVALTTAPAGTGITGLAYDRSLLSTWQTDQEQMLGLIVHEVGTHLLIDLYREMSDRELSAGNADWATWAAYAGLTAHYTRQIMPEFETEIENDVEIFAGVYRQLADEEPAADARRLMQQALDGHRAGRW